MAGKKKLSIDIYHRIYRMAAKGIPADQIAVTLDIPISISRNIVDQFFPTFVDASNNSEKAIHKREKTAKKTYLDIYILSEPRFSIIDLIGMVTEEHTTHLQKEFHKVLNSDIKTIAIRMTDVKTINEAGLSEILSFYKKFSNKGRYTAILDPSKDIENFFIKKEVEKEIPVFGTKKAFKESALKLKK